MAASDAGSPHAHKASVRKFPKVAAETRRLSCASVLVNTAGTFSRLMSLFGRRCQAFQHETRGHARPVATLLDRALLRPRPREHLILPEHRRCSLGTRSRAFATWNDGDFGASSQTSDTGSTPLRLRHSRIFLDIVTQILYRSVASQIVTDAFSRRGSPHAMQSVLSAQSSFCCRGSVATWGACAHQRRQKRAREASSIVIPLFLTMRAERYGPGLARTWAQAHRGGAVRQHGATAISSGKLSTHS